MNEYVEKLKRSLEPLIEDLHEKVELLSLKKEKLEGVSRFLAYVNGDANLVGVYADQNLILDSLEKIDSDKDEYKASCYLLRSDDVKIKSLPQYQKANEYIGKLINYFKTSKVELTSEITNLESVCNKKKIEKKYYDLFMDNSPLIEDVSEFESFLKDHTTTNEERINLLIYAINSNVINYENSEF